MYLEGGRQLDFLALDKTGDHKGATEHFKKAHELGKANPEIQNSGILKAHLKMK